MSTGRVLDRLDRGRLSDGHYFVGLVIWVGYRSLRYSLFAGAFNDGGVISDQYMFQWVSAILALSEAVRIWRDGAPRTDAVALVLLWLAGNGMLALNWQYMLGDIVLVFCARRRSVRQVVAVATAAAVIVSCFIVACSHAGIIEDAIFYHGERVRHGLGFTFCLYPAQMVFSFTLAWAWLRDGRWRLVEYLGVFAVTIACFEATRSRLSFYLGMLFLMLVGLRRVVGSSVRFWSYCSRLLRWAIPAAIVLTGLILVLWRMTGKWDGPLAVVDLFFERRITFAYEGLRTMRWSLFGRSVAMTGAGLDAWGNYNPQTAYNWIDNLYVHEAIRLGVAHLVVYWGLSFWAAWNAHRMGDHMLVFALAFLAAHALVDDLSLYLCFNTLMLVAAAPQGPFLCEASSGMRDGDDDEGLLPATDLPGAAL